MHPPSGIACLLALVCAIGCAWPAAARAVDIVVARDSGLSAAERADLRADAGVEHKRMLRLPNAEVVSAPAGRQAAALARLNADPDVRYAEPVVWFRLAQSNDALYDSQWALENVGQPLPPRGGVVGMDDADMDVPEAWAVSRGAGQTVAVIDSGIQETHEDLRASIAPGARTFVAGPVTGDPVGHGTNVAGVIAAEADNDLGVAGVAPEAKVLSLKAFSEEVGSSTAVAEAVNYAGDLGIRVANLSFNAPFDDQALREAIARHPATLYVVAAGNGEAGVQQVGDNVDAVAGGDSGPQYPCSYDLPNVLCVGASDYDDDVAPWSNYGARSVDLFAPGATIYTTTPSGYFYLRGTSLAAPMVAAEAALILSTRPNLSTASLRHLLLRSVDPIASAAGRSVTGGRANAGTLLTTPVVDTDGDGVLDELDSCRDVYEPSQVDVDGDGLGDVCDPTPRGDDADGDAKALLDDRCPTTFGTEPDGCPPLRVNPPGDGTPTPTPTVTPTPRPVPLAAVLTVGVKVTPKRCPRGRSVCAKAAKVTVKLSRAATVALRFDKQVKRGRRTVWRRYATRSLMVTSTTRSLTLRRLTSGSYRVKVTIAGKGKTKAFRVR